MSRLNRTIVLLGALCGALSAQAHKELGRMWTFENVPTAWFKEAYDFEPTAEWLEKVRLSALKFGNGCSASFVSPRGLIMTNHHCARGNVAKASPKDQDWLGDGYFAKSIEDEPKLEGLEVRQLVAMKDVTKEMNEGLGEAADDSARQAKLRDNRIAIEAAAKQAAGDYEHRVVALYQGGMYQLYSSKVYKDVRLVATPHLQCAKFGGDPDNFTYPRFGLDFTFVRAWENDRPADTSKHYFKWRTQGPTEGETTFVVGNPGQTGRLKSIAQMEFLRDIQLPRTLAMIKQRLDAANKAAAQSEARAKAARAEILNLENGRKAYQGYLDGLRNDKVMEIKRRAEKAARDKVAADPSLSAKVGDPWAELEAVCAQKRDAAEGKTKITPDEGKALGDKEASLEKRIGEAFFGLYGTSFSPDATLTTRISDGVVKGFDCNGTIAPYFTSLFGLYARHTEFGGKGDFELPQVWLDRMGKLDLKTPFNLVSTNDIIGGNSGSPMIDKEGRVVGLIFDGNIESLGNNYVFTEEVARSVSVHPAIIIESLRKVYDAPHIADEIEGVKARVPATTIR